MAWNINLVDEHYHLYLIMRYYDMFEFVLIFCELKSFENHIKCLAIDVVVYVFLPTNEIVGIFIAYEDLIFISRQISCCEMGWSFLRVGRYI